ncbi:thiol:disulfide oxidoreductase related to ResA [Bacillus sp. JCM 19046]|nr:thiol:disulfide oxidoreductase related to ResA [Bacillus sp. JCM 19046]
MLKKRYLTILVLSVALVITGIVLYQNQGSTKPLAEGDELPNMELELYGSGQKSLHDFKGQMVVLNVWASWCEPCIREMPELMDFAEETANDSVEVITVNMQNREYRASDATDFIEEQQLTLPVFLDSEGEFLAEIDPYRLPLTYILDEKLTVKEIVIGEVDADMLHNKISNYQ